MRRSAIIIFVLLTTTALSQLFAQDDRLAQQYFQNGEYEKAAEMYSRLYTQSGGSEVFFDRYVESLLALQRYAEAEEVIKKQLRRDAGNQKLLVTYGDLLERQLRTEEAREQYRAAIAKLPPDQYATIRLANAFISLSKHDYAIEAFEKGAQLLQDKHVFSYQLGDLYRQMNDTPKMIEKYLDALADNPGRMRQVKTILQRYLGQEDYRELQTQLYERLQNQSDTDYFNDLLAWVFIQRKDYTSAFRQVKALDRRLDENGGRIFELAAIAANDRDYDAAIAAYDYIVEEKGTASTFYLEAKREALRMRRLKLVDGYTYSEPDLRELESQYERFLNEMGRTRATAGILLELAELEALYINDLDKAIELLNETIAYPGIDPSIQARAKIALADYYLMEGDIWESTLLYSQVDKAFKEDPLGHEARFRNARLSYYTGDFQWAQAQFDVLKASTSKLIANDALDLSVFIMDNLGLDTTARALQLYAEAELLVFRNLFGEANGKMDTLLAEFPEHALDDDVYYLKAKIFRKKRQYDEAAAMYQAIIDNYTEGIRVDNALFELAQLYETQLNDQDKAKQLYETLFIDHSGSVFAVEARKRFRVLRGDKIQ